SDLFASIERLGLQRLTGRADSFRVRRHVANVPIVLKKSFLTDGKNFSDPLVRSARGDVREPHRSSLNRPSAATSILQALQQRKHRRVDLREIFGALRFSTFSTVSVIFAR